MNLKPMRNRVVIKTTEVEEKSAGGIFIPLDSKKEPTTGHVIACGGDDLGDTLNIGDMVLFGKFAGTKIEVQNENFIMMKYTDILAVIEK